LRMEGCRWALGLLEGGRFVRMFCSVVRDSFSDISFLSK